MEETSIVEEKALTITDQAKAVKVTDAETYTVAGTLWKAIGDMIKEVEATFSPICDSAHKAWKITVAKRDGFLDPLKEARASVKAMMAKYDAQQEAIRLAEQRRLEEIARKEAEERALMDAIAAEEDAKRNGATKEEAQQEAAAIIDVPVYVAPVVIPKEVPKVAGLSFRTIWKFQITDAGKIPAQYMVPDEVKIGQVVRALKQAANIPGIRVFEERC